MNHDSFQVENIGFLNSKDAKSNLCLYAQECLKQRLT